jgi:hypothetical protein
MRHNPVWIRPEGTLHARNLEAAYDIAYDNPGESTTDMALHAGLIGVAGFAAMIYGLKQDQETAMKHSAILAGAAFLYMGVFGHGLPTEKRGPFFQEG